MTVPEKTIPTVSSTGKSVGKMLGKYTLVESVAGALVVVALYLLIIMKLLPSFMMNRKPFVMKRVLLVYNALQVLFSGYVLYVYGDYVLRYSFFPKNCPHINRQYYPMVLYNCSLYFIAKHVDLLDTVFFRLRKKDNQVSFLHVYHHSIMVIWAWICYLYLPSDHYVLIGAMNSFVHVIMYSYYGISSLGPQYTKYLWWKKHLTKIQLVQFVLALTTTYFQQKLSPCPMPDFVQNFFMFALISFFVLFMDFYLRSYRNKRSTEAIKSNGNGVNNLQGYVSERKSKI
ncbi:very long chain fatty acid elongase 4-like [Battus philenor]|uniref:very long chain fatty acid elongase 4-like n=1 Tax=Battus philenor TaxID=42288 RepID=UPI0035CEDB8A